MGKSNPNKLLVVGGGAAGVFCAVTAAKCNPKLQVTIAEKTGKLLQKVKISGGGRCNVTHACFDIGEMVNRYPRGKNFLKKAFHQFFTTNTIQWFEQRGVPLKTESDGRMFPKANTSQAIVDALQNEIDNCNVQIRYNTVVQKVIPQENCFKVQLSNGLSETFDYVFIACGGQYKPEQFEWLNNFSFKIIKPVPSLFTFNFPQHPLTALSGVSVPHTQVKIVGFKQSMEGPLLITHWGVSGPAVLKLSAFAAVFLAEANYQYEVVINWVAHKNEVDISNTIQELRNQSANQKVTNGNFTSLPARLWEFLINAAGISENKRWADLKSGEMNKLAAIICQYRVQASGKTTYKDEFVTAGGIDLSEIDPNSMMSRRFPGLYFGGEILNVDGITGGYNFQHAWTSGFIAGTHIGKASMLENV